jgi:hypothetical protein
MSFDVSALGEIDIGMIKYLYINVRLKHIKKLHMKMMIRINKILLDKLIIP